MTTITALRGVPPFMERIILIVDDIPELLDGVKLTLEMEGYQVLAAKNGQEALDVLERITPDLILTDIMMPEIDGYELYERVHADERWVQVPFIFLTAKTDTEDIRRGKEMGADDYITKPFEPEDIISAIRGRMMRLEEVTTQAANQEKAKRGNMIPLSVVTVGVLFLISLFIGGLLFSPAGSEANATAGAFTSPLPTEEVEPKETAVTRDLNIDLDDMVTIPAGEFLMGDESLSTGSETVALAEFKIDRYEVVNSLYKEFVEATEHPAPWESYPLALEQHPVTNVSWEDASAFCEWAGKRLPTEAEWEKAARGSDGRIFPWGDAWEDERANTQESGLDGLQPVGNYDDGVSPYEVYDMAGNAAEWVNDWFDPTEEAKVVRGGSANAIQRWAQTFSRNQLPPTFKQDTLGFRCAE